MHYKFIEFDDLFTPSRCAFNPVANSQLDVSNINRSQTISANPGTWYKVSYFFSVMEKNKALELRSLLIKLRGHLHTIGVKDPKYTPNIPWLGTPRIDGANQYGYVINVKGLNANTLVARSGERLVIDGQINETIDDVTTDGTGRAAITLAVEHRNLTVDNQFIVTDTNQLYATCTWLNPSQIEQFSGTKRLYRGIQLDFAEAF